MSKPTDTIEVIVLHKSTKAIFVELRDGRHIYIPDSIIHSDVEHIPEFQEITVDLWFTQKKEIY